MSFHWVTTSGYDFSANKGRFSIDISIFYPKEELLLGVEKNLIGMTLFIGPLVILGILVNQEMLSFCILNTMVAIVWSY